MMFGAGVDHLSDWEIRVETIDYHDADSINRLQ